MLLKGRSKEITELVIQRFRKGNVTAPLATIYLTRHDDKPMSNWSILNQLICVWSGCLDARGFDQWRETGRHVKKGEKARATILIPIRPYVKNGQRDDEEETRRGGATIGFTTCPVFDIDQTEGDPLPNHDPHRPFLDALPLADVARTWNIRTGTYNGKDQKFQAAYSPHANAILLGVGNIDTWLHELVHAADDRLGNLTEKGQHWRSETVAQLGACALCHLIGIPEHADEGGTFSYITRYAQEAGIEPVTACGRVLDRVTQALDLILATHAAATPAY